jgi:hypothetical protein
VLEVEGKAVMLAADYFRGPDEVEAAVLWLKRQAPRAAVIWRDLVPRLLIIPVAFASELSSRPSPGSEPFDRRPHRTRCR